jgi:hypothetical protein
VIFRFVPLITEVHGTVPFPQLMTGPALGTIRNYSHITMLLEFQQYQWEPLCSHLIYSTVQKSLIILHATVPYTFKSFSRSTLFSSIHLHNSNLCELKTKEHVFQEQWITYEPCSDVVIFWQVGSEGWLLTKFTTWTQHLYLETAVIFFEFVTKKESVISTLLRKAWTDK